MSSRPDTDSLSSETLAAQAGGARRRRKEARPQELLAAALELFVEKGYAATRSEEVAARAGVSKGTLYLYYASKEELFKAMVRDCLGSPIAEARAMAAQFEGSMTELLAILLREWWAHMGQTAAGGISKIMMAEARNFPELASFFVDEVINPSNDQLAEVIRRGIAAGEFRPVPADAAVEVLIAPMLHMVMHQHSFGACSVGGRTVDPEAVLQVQLDLMLNGLLAPSEKTN
jgi:AcrR family transcriptional regulator